VDKVCFQPNTGPLLTLGVLTLHYRHVSDKDGGLSHGSETALEIPPFTTLVSSPAPFYSMDT